MSNNDIVNDAKCKTDNSTKNTLNDRINDKKEIVKKIRNEKIICDVCKGSTTYANKSIHIKTKKHQYELLKRESDTKKSNELINKISNNFNINLQTVITEHVKGELHKLINENK